MHSVQGVVVHLGLTQDRSSSEAHLAHQAAILELGADAALSKSQSAAGGVAFWF